MIVSAVIEVSEPNGAICCWTLIHSAHTSSSFLAEPGHPDYMIHSSQKKIGGRSGLSVLDKEVGLGGGRGGGGKEQNFMEVNVLALHKLVIKLIFALRV